MITNILISILQAVDTVYNSLGVSTLLADLLQKLNTPFQYQTDFSYYMSGVYFIFGKPLVIYFISVAGIIIAIRLVLAVVNLVWP